MKDITPETHWACADCGARRTKEEGGTTFTLCDKCWDKHHKKQSPEWQADIDRRKILGDKMTAIEKLECPWPETVFTMGEDAYVKAIPDHFLRTRIAGFLMRAGWKVAISEVMKEIGEDV